MHLHTRQEMRPLHDGGGTDLSLAAILLWAVAFDLFLLDLSLAIVRV